TPKNTTSQTGQPQRDSQGAQPSHDHLRAYSSRSDPALSASYRAVFEPTRMARDAMQARSDRYRRADAAWTDHRVIGITYMGLTGSVLTAGEKTHLTRHRPAAGCRDEFERFINQDLSGLIDKHIVDIKLLLVNPYSLAAQLRMIAEENWPRITIA